MTTESAIDPDAPVWGVKEIAPIIRRSARQTYEFLEKGLIPGKKIGKTWRRI